MGESDESMSIPVCEKFQKRLQDMGVDVELKVYAGAGHGWDNPYPQKFVDGAYVTRDCLMRWNNDGSTVEVTSGRSMDNPVGAMLALSKCANDDGYTMGFNQLAHDQSRADLLGFLRRVWEL